MSEEGLEGDRGSCRLGRLSVNSEEKGSGARVTRDNEGIHTRHKVRESK